MTVKTALMVVLPVVLIGLLLVSAVPADASGEQTAQAYIDVDFVYQLTPAGSDVSSFYGIPPGLSFNVDTGRISGVPTTAGTYRATAIYHPDASDYSATATAVVEIAVAEPVFRVGFDVPDGTDPSVTVTAHITNRGESVDSAYCVYNWTVTDSDGNYVTSGNTRTLSHTFESTGDYVLKVTATSIYGTAASVATVHVDVEKEKSPAGGVDAVTLVAIGASAVLALLIFRRFL